jgi:hypothetical protein
VIDTPHTHLEGSATLRAFNYLLPERRALLAVVMEPSTRECDVMVSRRRLALSRKCRVSLACFYLTSAPSIHR